jgi:two-component system OmpR family response regulator
MRVLLIEDDWIIGAAVQAALQEVAYAADWVRNGQIGLDTLSMHRYDLVLLDLDLPGKDGIAVLNSLRAKNNPVPVVIMTGRGGLEDRLRGLNSGADDYLVKPFDMAELLARMRAILRRKAGNGFPFFTNGVLSLDPVTRRALTGRGEPVQLSKREFTLLQALLVRPGAILSREELEDRIYGSGDEVESNAIEFLIHSLRRKVGREMIKNVRGAGWMVPKHG